MARKKGYIVYGWPQDRKITLCDEHGEIVMWLESEWVEDPSIVYSIANAIYILEDKGPDALRRMIGKEIK